MVGWEKLEKPLAGEGCWVLLEDTSVADWVDGE